MSRPEPRAIESRDNALFKDLRRLAQNSGAWRRQGRVLIEGEHLCQAALVHGLKPMLGVFSRSYWSVIDSEMAQAAEQNVVLDDGLMAQLSGLESPASLAFVLALPAESVLRAGVATVVLDRIQDAGNVGSILRSAAAFGFAQIAAIRGTAGLWSPKVVRAGMGAHFGLHLVDGLEATDIKTLGVPLLVTSVHEGQWLHQASLPWPCAWVLGHEGQGVDSALMAHATVLLRITQPGGQESLNVAAAAAVCLHASAATRVS